MSHDIPTLNDGSYDMRHLLHRFVVAASIAVAVARPALSQNTLTLEGLVKSDAGPISGAQVTIVDSSTQTTSQTTTRPTGEFRVIGLSPGQYLLFSQSGKKISLSAEVFNLFNWNNNLSYGGTQYTATGGLISTFGVPTGAYAARQGQVGMRIDW
jgi:hypothetical protein